MPRVAPHRRSNSCSALSSAALQQHTTDFGGSPNKDSLDLDDRMETASQSSMQSAATCMRELGSKCSKSSEQLIQVIDPSKALITSELNNVAYHCRERIRNRRMDLASGKERKPGDDFLDALAARTVLFSHAERFNSASRGKNNHNQLVDAANALNDAGVKLWPENKEVRIDKFLQTLALADRIEDLDLSFKVSVPYAIPVCDFAIRCATERVDGQPRSSQADTFHRILCGHT